MEYIENKNYNNISIMAMTNINHPKQDNSTLIMT